MDIKQRRGGWLPDIPDPRDYTVQHPVIERFLRRLKPDPEQRRLPDRVDWREFFAPAEDQGGLPTSSAHACAALLQYFERRCRGRMLQPSRLFLHHNAATLLQQPAAGGVSLRGILQSLIHFGAPDERYWPYSVGYLASRPPPFAYGFADRFRKARFLRLDVRQEAIQKTLRLAKSFLAAGFPFLLGFPVSNALGADPLIPFPTVFDRICTGMAVVAVGYDDGLRVLSDKGALLIRNSWGTRWGEQGYGWLPYAYLESQLARDLWTLVKPSWLKSGEIFRPAID